MSIDGQCTKRRRNIAENFNLLSRVYERYRQSDDRRQTDGRRHIANVNVEIYWAWVKILQEVLGGGVLFWLTL